MCNLGKKLLAAWLLGAMIIPQAFAQDASVTAIPAPPEPDAIALGTGGISRSGAPETWFRQYGVPMVRNVTNATLTPVLPVPGKGNGSAVIVAPGGAGMWLSMDNEGWSVARALADHGIAAFVLKYRLRPTPASLDDFARFQIETFANIGKPGTRLKPADAVSGMAIQIADAKAAFALVRARSGQWGIDPNRVGMLGFSAGAMTTVATTLGAPETRPAFIAPIYGSMESVRVPTDAPPMFAVLASDDPLFARKGLGLIDAWQQAGRPVEFHLYTRGGHGFGLGKRGTSSLGWMDAFVLWLRTEGLIVEK